VGIKNLINVAYRKKGKCNRFKSPTFYVFESWMGYAASMGM
jgi:hypothetical protein